MLAHQGQFGIEAMCRVLRVSRSAFYDFKACPTNQRDRQDRDRQDKELKAKIQSVFKEYEGRYGSPRVHLELCAQGFRCSPKRVARLMRELELVATKPLRFVTTTDSRHGFPVAANLLNREFDVEAIADVNRKWAGDITYIATAQGWLYLAVVLDLKSRKVVGWSMKDTIDKSLVQEALEMATKRRLDGPMKENLLFHSDRGSQYASSSYREQLEQHGIICSMSRKGNCWDNAPLESFFATLKKELGNRHKYQSHQQTKASLFYYIEVFYNRKRRHSALGYISPHDYEQASLI
jgi:transposase InsO family protein